MWSGLIWAFSFILRVKECEWVWQFFKELLITNACGYVTYHADCFYCRCRDIGFKLVLQKKMVLIQEMLCITWLGKINPHFICVDHVNIGHILDVIIEEICGGNRVVVLNFLNFFSTFYENLKVCNHRIHQKQSHFHIHFVEVFIVCCSAGTSLWNFAFSIPRAGLCCLRSALLIDSISFNEILVTKTTKIKLMKIRLEIRN